MKRTIFWLMTAATAFFLGQLVGAGRAEQREPEREGRDANVAAATQPRPRRSRIGALFLSFGFGLAEAWLTAARTRASQLGRERREALTGRLGGSAAISDFGFRISDVGTAGDRPAARVDRRTTADPSPDVGRRASVVEAPTSEIRNPKSEIAAGAGWMAYVKELARRFSEHQTGVSAAALSFFGLVSIGPILLVGLSVLGFLLHSPEHARHQLIQLIANVLPGTDAPHLAGRLLDQFDVESQVQALMSARGPAAAIGVLSLIWASMQIFVSSAAPMNAAWGAPEKRSWIRLRLVALGLLVGAGVLFLLSLLPSSGPDMIRRLHIPWLGLPQHVPGYVHLLFVLLGVVINAAMFTLIYRFLPAADVTWREAAVGGIFMGVLWEAAKQLFSFYLAHFGAQNATYKALGGLMLFILWIYYTSMLLLLGAEVSALYRAVTKGTAKA